MVLRVRFSPSVPVGTIARCRRRQSPVTFSLQIPESRRDDSSYREVHYCPCRDFGIISDYSRRLSPTASSRRPYGTESHRSFLFYPVFSAKKILNGGARWGFDSLLIHFRGLTPTAKCSRLSEAVLHNGFFEKRRCPIGTARSISVLSSPFASRKATIIVRAIVNHTTRRNEKTPPDF